MITIMIMITITIKKMRLLRHSPDPRHLRHCVSPIEAQRPPEAIAAIGRIGRETRCSKRFSFRPAFPRNSPAPCISTYVFRTTAMVRWVYVFFNGLEPWCYQVLEGAKFK